MANKAAIKKRAAAKAGKPAARKRGSTRTTTRTRGVEGTALTASRHIRFGLYGDSGIGKTRLVGTTEGKVMLIRTNVDHIDSILSAGMGANIEERVVRDWTDSNDLRDELRQDGARWDWVWLDSASLWQDVMMDDVWAAAIHDRPDRYRYGLDKQEHGINQLRMGTWIRHVVGADLFNFGWTAHAQDLPSPDLDEQGDPIEKLMPYIHGGQGNFAQKWCGYSNFVAYMRKDKKGRRLLHTESNAIYYAKNQYEPRGVDWELVSPTMPMIMDRIKSNGRTGSSRTARKRRAGTRRAK